MTKITIDKLKERIAYDPHTGALFNAKTAQPVGHITDRGYTVITLDGKTYRGTHIAHALMTGDWPSLTIDHKDRDPTNNKWDNLREATPREQIYNQGVSKRSTTGIRGVYPNDNGKRFRARIQLPSGKEIGLGTYDTIEEAKLARMKAELEHFGKFSPLVNA